MRRDAIRRVGGFLTGGGQRGVSGRRTGTMYIAGCCTAQCRVPVTPFGSYGSKVCCTVFLPSIISTGISAICVEEQKNVRAYCEFELATSLLLLCIGKHSFVSRI